MSLQFQPRSINDLAFRHGNIAMVVGFIVMYWAGLESALNAVLKTTQSPQPGWLVDQNPTKLKNPFSHRVEQLSKRYKGAFPGREEKFDHFISQLIYYGEIRNNIVHNTSSVSFQFYEDKGASISYTKEDMNFWLKFGEPWDVKVDAGRRATEYGQYNHELLMKMFEDVQRMEREIRRMRHIAVYKVSPDASCYGLD